MGSGKKINVSKKPATLKVDVAQNLFLQPSPQDVSEVWVSHIPLCAQGHACPLMLGMLFYTDSIVYFCIEQTCTLTVKSAFPNKAAIASESKQHSTAADQLTRQKVQLSTQEQQNSSHTNDNPTNAISQETGSELHH